MLGIFYQIQEFINLESDTFNNWERFGNPTMVIKITAAALVTCFTLLLKLATIDIIRCC
jgi:hypothetical protein